MLSAIHHSSALKMKDKDFVRRVIGVMSLDQGIMNPYEPMYTPERTVAISHLFTPAALQMWMSRVMEIEVDNHPRSSSAPSENSSNNNNHNHKNNSSGSRKRQQQQQELENEPGTEFVDPALNNNIDSTSAGASGKDESVSEKCFGSRSAKMSTRNPSFKIPKKYMRCITKGNMNKAAGHDHLTKQQRKRIPIILGMIEPDSTVSPSRIPNMSLGEMRKCLNEVRTLAPEDINPDRALSNGMLLGNFSIAFVNNSANVNNNINASTSTLMSQSSPARLMSSNVIMHKRSVPEAPRRLKQTSLTNYIARDMK